MELLHTAHIPAGDGPHPAVIALHGWGASAHDLIGLAPILQGGQAVVLCPQGPIQVPIAQGVVGCGWFPLSEGRDPDPEEFATGARLIREFVDAAMDHYPIDPSRVVLLGFSQGGVMGYDLFLRQPEKFAGLAALSSWLPPELSKGLGVDASHGGRPVLVMHGSDDPMIPVDRARESRDALLPYGLDVTYREHEMGHEIKPEALRDLIVWLNDKCFQRIQLA